MNTEARLRDIVRLAEAAGATDTRKAWGSERGHNTIYATWHQKGVNKKPFDPFTSLDDAWLLPAPDPKMKVGEKGFKAWSDWITYHMERNVHLNPWIIKSAELADIRVRAFAASKGIELET